MLYCYIAILLYCYIAFGQLLAVTQNSIHRTENTEVENFHYWSVLVGRVGRSKSGRSHLKHLISIWGVKNDFSTKFELNRMKFGRVSPL